MNDTALICADDLFIHTHTRVYIYIQSQSMYPTGWDKLTQCYLYVCTINFVKFRCTPQYNDNKDYSINEIIIFHESSIKDDIN